MLLQYLCLFTALFLCCSPKPLHDNSCSLQRTNSDAHCCACSDFFGLGLYSTSERSQKLCNLCQKKLIVQEGNQNQLFCDLCHPLDIFCHKPTLSYGHSEYGLNRTIENRTAQFDVTFDGPSCGPDTEVHCSYEHYTASRHLCICENPESLVDNFKIWSIWNREDNTWSISLESSSNRQISENETADCKYNISWKIVEPHHVQRSMHQLQNITNCPNYCIARLPDIIPWDLDTRLALRVKAKTLMETTVQAEISDFAIRDIFMPSEPPTVSRVTSGSVHLSIKTPKVGEICTGRNQVTATYTIFSPDEAINGTISAISIAEKGYCTTHGLMVDNLYSDTEYNMYLTYYVAMSLKSTSPLFTIPFHTSPCDVLDKQCRQRPLHQPSTKLEPGSTPNILYVVVIVVVCIAAAGIFAVVAVIAIFTYRRNSAIKRSEQSDILDRVPLHDLNPPDCPIHEHDEDDDSDAHYCEIDGDCQGMDHIDAYSPKHPPPNRALPPIPEQVPFTPNHNNGNPSPSICEQEASPSTQDHKSTVRNAPRPYGKEITPGYSTVNKTRGPHPPGQDIRSAESDGYTPVVNGPTESYREYSDFEFITENSQQNSSQYS